MKKDKHAPAASPSPQQPNSNDRGYHRGPHTGPTPEQRERWEKLSDGAKEKVRNLFRDNRDRVMNMTDEQRRSFFESNFKSIEATDKSGK